MNAQDIEAAAGGTIFRKLSIYARLGNFKVYFQWIPVLVAWSLAERPFGLDVKQALALLAFIGGTIAMGCSAGTLDDIQGFRDGIDQRTYAGEDSLRPTSGKPLVLGEISEQAAYRFALLMGAVGPLLGVAAVLLTPHRSVGLFLAIVVTAYASTQYSYGVRLSYHGAGELLLGVLATSVFLIPLVLLDGHVPAAGWFEGCLLGALQAQVTIFSSSYDADEDRAAGRMTLAARLTPAANRRFIAAVFAVSWIVTATGLTLGVLDRWLLLAFLPMWACQAVQLRRGLVQKRWLDARHFGWRAFDAGVVALVIVNLLAGR